MMRGPRSRFSPPTLAECTRRTPLCATDCLSACYMAMNPVRMGAPLCQMPCRLPCHHIPRGSWRGAWSCVSVISCVGPKVGGASRSDIAPLCVGACTVKLAACSACARVPCWHSVLHGVVLRGVLRVCGACGNARSA